MGITRRYLDPVKERHKLITAISDAVYAPYGNSTAFRHRRRSDRFIPVVGTVRPAALSLNGDR
jgi:hypothetical protein